MVLDFAYCLLGDKTGFWIENKTRGFFFLKALRCLYQNIIYFLEIHLVLGVALLS